MYSLIKEENLLKVWGASGGEISSTFWENIGTFFIGNGAEIWPQKQPWKSLYTIYRLHDTMESQVRANGHICTAVSVPIFYLDAVVAIQSTASTMRWRVCINILPRRCGGYTIYSLHNAMESLYQYFT